MPHSPHEVTQCSCGHVIPPHHGWRAWDTAALDHTARVTPVPDAGKFVAECRHHGLTEFILKFRSDGSRQRTCVQCKRASDVRTRDRRRERVQSGSTSPETTEPPSAGTT